MPHPFHDPLVARIATFLESIGLPADAAPLEAGTFLPGVTVRAGRLVIDEARLLYPGDLLHEAGHLAVLTPAARSRIDEDPGGDGGLEMGAIAWSYAAALHLGLAPQLVFHAAGYRGGAESLCENFAAGRYVGVPILEWLGLAAGAKLALERGVEPYPAMLRWLREAEPASGI